MAAGSDIVRASILVLGVCGAVTACTGSLFQSKAVPPSIYLLSAPPGTTDDELKAVERATPLGRWGGEPEIAKTVLALLDSDFITGETIRVDGGRHVN